ncbi:serine/threonine protein kinase [Myxococcus stipitatus DSM 14675]|uniref:Serine/threonine protein kinase n=1 Tax=Myxococcus stipitatus (strain DSM 14675 / JCM 12634 / Mx s8) TaxID=1278073 RepID=L7UP12_MYXSD|nr:serine/threonine-protein kinase [Myxococcus stipitatus]AGC48244.1 serine/threonine protein kinase [Myxococcus stipitatus DSM 14675]
MRTEIQTVQPATHAAWSADPLVGQVLHGRFQVLAPLGGGGPVRLYRALQLPARREVVLHVLSTAHADGEAQRGFLQEARVAARLGHPNTVTVLDAGRMDDGTVYVALEWLQGRTLAEQLASGPLAWEQAVALARGVGRSLRHAHQRGVVHGEVSSSNVLLVTDGELLHVKVRGFGRARPVAAKTAHLSVRGVTEGGVLPDAPAYMAPERARHVVDASGDVYSLGVVLYEMLVGRVPFVSEDPLELVFAHHKELPPRFSELRPDLDIPAAVEAVVRRCLEKLPEQRFASVDAVLEALREVGGEGAAHASVSGLRAPAPRWVAAVTGLFRD